MKLKPYFLIIALLVPFLAQPQLTIRGIVVDSANHQPLSGAAVFIKDSQVSASTGKDGRFSLPAKEARGSLVISYLSYRTSIPTYNTNREQTFLLSSLTQHIDEVVVSTGYQQLARERATGSFVHIDNELINRSVGPDILSRLADVTSGLIFNRNVPGRVNDISIRGQSTLFSNAQPLIVLDNFPCDGDLNNINPNDVESVTVLKDAAAASIWGSRAGNGVIVITTKKGAYNKPLKISFNANLTVGNKPNLFYRPVMSSADYIDVEQMLFKEGFYHSAEVSPSNAPLTPVVDLLIAERDGTLSADDANAQINALKGQDVRNDLAKYIYRRSVAQQYALNLSGGTAAQKYYVSAGYDGDAGNLIRNGFQKLTVIANDTYSLIPGKLDLTTSFNLTKSVTTADNPGAGGIYTTPAMGLYPYARLADANGNPLSIVKDYRASFIAQAQEQGLLNWQYEPLADLRDADNTTKITDYRLSAALKYRILPQLSAEATYLYERGLTAGTNNQNEASYYTRNLINSFTQGNPNGTLSYPVPLGGIFDLNDQDIYSNDLRAQLNYDEDFGTKSSVSAIAGYEIRSTHTVETSFRSYGYDGSHDISSPVDYITPYAQYFYPDETAQVPFNDSGMDLADHNLSYYSNAAYTYDKRYTVSASARFDQSNLFGVKTNQKGVPLWSAGFAWNLSEEPFYKIGWLPTLRLRATYGVSGNVNKGVSAYTTAYFYNAQYSPINAPYAQIINPPDPELSWEQIKTWNLGIDFELAKNTLSGSLEYYQKKGTDLIGSAPVAPSTGNLTFTANDAATNGHGIDLVLNSINIRGTTWNWQTNLLYSYVTNIVSRYSGSQNVSDYLQFGYGGESLPLQGKPLYAIYSYRSAGLDPSNGNPRGYLNGVVSEDYAAIIAAATPQNIQYNGPAQPTSFGSLRNTFGWKGFSLSANISYRLGYYFRKTSVRYSTVLEGEGGSGDYALRWQTPGDEAHTQVPSLPAAIDLNRDNLYSYSNVLVGKGDNIRLQDLNFSYDIGKAKSGKLPFNHMKIYLYANNLALLWKANKFGIDPDYQTGPPPKTLALGFKMDL
jgi:TonB-linked SusC/RagA family outer membrane protein